MNTYFRPMGKTARILFCLLILVSFSNCEKDDICVDGDTPLLVLGFFDISDAAASKDVPSLRIQAVGLEAPPTTFTDRSAQDSIGIPLRVNTTSTQFVLINNSATDSDSGLETGNSDTLTFNYSVVERFVSRGCGFIANFDEIVPELTTDDNNWIQNVTVENSSIANSSAIHVKIFH